MGFQIINTVLNGLYTNANIYFRMLVRRLLRQYEHSDGFNSNRLWHISSIPFGD